MGLKGDIGAGESHSQLVQLRSKSTEEHTLGPQARKLALGDFQALGRQLRAMKMAAADTDTGKTLQVAFLSGNIVRLLKGKVLMLQTPVLSPWTYSLLLSLPVYLCAVTSAWAPLPLPCLLVACPLNGLFVFLQC